MHNNAPSAGLFSGPALPEIYARQWWELGVRTIGSTCNCACCDFRYPIHDHLWSSPTTSQLVKSQVLSQRALEKQAVRDHHDDHQLTDQRAQQRDADANAIPQVPPEAYSSLSGRPATIASQGFSVGRPQPKYRKSFLETFLARQQNKETAATTTLANTSRVINPINHIPRPTPVHFSQPDRADSIEKPSGRETRTLLTLPEQRRSRQNSPNTPTFQESFTPDLESGHRTSIGLPSNQRRSAQSLDLPFSPMSQEKPLPASPPVTKPPTRQNTQEREISANLPSKLASNYGFSEQDQPAHPPRRVSSQRSLHHVRSLGSVHSSTFARTDSGPAPPLPASQQATPTQAQHSPNTDLERGPGSDGTDHVDEEPPWGSSHPCYPHLNPHVPLHSPTYNATRIIRIRRDWMVMGDLAPTYSNMYPEILDPLLPEQEFRYIINHINRTLIKAYDPMSISNWVDGIMGFLTGWFWEDVRTGGVKGELKKLEAWIEEWNRTIGAGDGVKLIPLRRTGYMCLDIQIPDPQVRVIEHDGRGDAESNFTSRPPGTGTSTALRS